MDILHVDLHVRPNASQALEKTFRDVFRPAISAQEGFMEVGLLPSRSQADHYRLVIKFASEPLRLKWVATELHQQVWPALEGHCLDYGAESFDAGS